MSKKVRFNVWAGRALALALALVLPACGGGSSSPTQVTVPPPPTPQPIVRSTVVQSGGSLPVDNLGRVAFTTSASGTLEVTVDWTFASNYIVVYVARGNCSFDQFVADQCPIATLSETMTPKPRVLTVSGAAAGSYTVFVGNVGPTDESVAVQVVLITGPGFSAVPQSAMSTSPSQSHRFIEGRDLR